MGLNYNYVTYGTGSGIPMLHFPFASKLHPSGAKAEQGLVSAGPSSIDGAVPVVKSGSTIMASSLPLIVPFASAAAGAAVVDNPSNLPTSSPSPATAVNGNGAAVAQTSAPFSLGSYLASVLASPGQHIVGIVIIAIALWWLWKHVLKKI